MYIYRNMCILIKHVLVLHTLYERLQIVRNREKQKSGREEREKKITEVGEAARRGEGEWEREKIFS